MAVKVATHTLADEIRAAFEGPVGVRDLLALGTTLKADLQAGTASPELVHRLLELGHLPAVNRAISASGKVEEWLAVLVDLVKASRYSSGVLLRQRAERYGEKPLFQVVQGKQVQLLTYRQAWESVQEIGAALGALAKRTDGGFAVGILSPNSLRGALLDLACLGYGFRVVPVPVNSTPAHLRFILDHSSVTHLFLGGGAVRPLIEEARLDSRSREVFKLTADDLPLQAGSWGEFLQLGQEVSTGDRLTGSMDTVATLMYTSGTTAAPKGIIFSQANIMAKRFARALALPELGPEDRFLSYLPLYHTFGRYLELMGTIFWGATYTFAESPSFKSLLKDFKLVRPSVFISIPKRWIQVQEHVGTLVSLDRAPDDEIAAQVREVTGGDLQWGLSAAGYLDPDVFLFFQRVGINLLSGYGMTEATGGITMTPPGEYRVNSVGRALPGIELRLGEDGELLIKSPYVSPGYYGTGAPPGADPAGWFHTGDIFTRKRGHYYIMDRKKEIYKNSRGQTISPQKIENMFQDFDAVKSVFLVGDGREYNTLLIYPDPEHKTLDLARTSEEEVRVYFSSLVSSVNSFLPSYERIVNFALVGRDFSAAEGELTSKGTYKRKLILKHFAPQIEPMYAKDYISLIHDQQELRVPNWILRDKGLVRGDIHWDGSHLALRGREGGLPLVWKNDHLRLGDLTYHTDRSCMNLEAFLASPELWLGNRSLVDFIGELATRRSSFEDAAEIRLLEEGLDFQALKSSSRETSRLTASFQERPPSLATLHTAALVLWNPEGKGPSAALEHLSQALEEKQGNLRAITARLLIRLRHHPDPQVRNQILNLLLPEINAELFVDLFQDIYRKALETRRQNEFHLAVELLQESHFEALLKNLGNYRRVPPEQVDLINALLEVVAAYGSLHPGAYILARSELVWWGFMDHPRGLKRFSRAALKRLVEGFRSWLGQPDELAIDSDSGEEFTWGDTILCDANIDPALERRLLQALSGTTLVREAIFLFSGRHLIHLNAIQPKGIYASFLGRRHGKSVVRVLVQTREMEAFNFVINFNEELAPIDLQDEINWLILTGSSSHGPKLVEEFGGYWPGYNLYTEEYIPGETVAQRLDRKRDEITQGQRQDRWQMRWLHYIWNGLIAYLEFWKRSDCQLAIANPSVANLIIPEHDYAVGTRLISITDRKPMAAPLEMLLGLYRTYVVETEEEFTGLKKMADWEVVFTALMEVFGLERGGTILQQVSAELSSDAPPSGEGGSAFGPAYGPAYGLSSQRVKAFLEEVASNGIITKQVVFAALRYQRWLDLNPRATLKARGAIIKELYEDYGLRDLAHTYPETRLRFFLMTGLKDANAVVIDSLGAILKDLRHRRISEDDLAVKLHEIHDSRELSREEKFFLTRLVYEHVDAAEYAELIALDQDPTGRLDLVVLTEDKQGERLRIRPPFHPKEVARFHSLLFEANLPVQFQPQHEFLVLINKKEHIVGGIYWKVVEPHTAYLERIVIAPHYRKRNLSIQLIEELFNRLRSRHYRHITVGFFQAGLFYKLGFQIDKKFGGLVKHL